MDLADPAPASSAGPIPPPSRSAVRDVLRLAGPAIASGFVGMGYHWVNQFWVGRLGTAPTAALSVATFGIWALYALSMLVSVGLAALVGRYSGGGRTAAASWIGAQGIRWALALAVVTGAAGWWLVPVALSVSDPSPEALALGTEYLRIAYAGAFAAWGLAACEAVFRGHGTTLLPFLVSAGGLVVNLVLDPILIFGDTALDALKDGSSPPVVHGMGVAGAAVATLVSNALSFVVSLAVLRRVRFVGGKRPPDADLRLDARTPLSPGPVPAFDLSVLARLVRVGVPVSCSGIVFVVIYLVLSRFVNEAGGDAALAALGVGLRGEQFAFVVGSGFSAAAAVLVARRLGAHRPDEAATGAWTATRLASLACLAWAIALFVLADPLSRFFLGSGDPVALSHARAYYRIVAFCLVPQCWEVVLEGAFGGAGMTIPPMVVSVLLTATRIPLAAWAASSPSLGVHAIWIVIAATAALRGVFVSLWFARGTWKSRTV